MSSQQILEALREERDKVERALAILSNNKPPRHTRRRRHPLQGTHWTPEHRRRFLASMKAKRLEKKKATQQKAA